MNNPNIIHAGRQVVGQGPMLKALSVITLGMMMLPPVMISLPIKLVFFIVIDGWFVIIGNLAQSFK